MGESKVDKLIMGDRIREARKRLNLTQDQLSEKLDITFTYMSEIERGLKMPSMPLFIKLVEVLKDTPDLIIGIFEE